MEYPMCTLILGEGTLDGLIGVMVHEVAHSWYQAVLASNEALYAWMDEGFTDFAAHEFEAFMSNKKPDHAGNYGGYFALVKSGLQEPISQHSDHFNTNRAYSTGAYSMGSVFLHQLKYIIGEEVFYKGMRQYFNTWKFKHPEPNDFIRVMEKVSGLQLRWYMQYWVNTTKKVDYSVKTLTEHDAKSFVTLERVGDFPMPVDVVVTYKDGTKEIHYIPLSEMRGAKAVEDQNMQRTELAAWPWVNPTYTLSLNHKSADITMIEIDPSLRMADVERRNNKMDLSQGVKAFEPSTR
jgi:aminopeptidase N